MAIYAYAPSTTDFTANGLGQLMPTECIVTEIENGMYEAQLKHPIDTAFLNGQAEKWRKLGQDVILSIPVVTRTLPEIVDTSSGPQIITKLERWRVISTLAKVRVRASSASIALRALARGAIWTVTLKNGNWFKGRDSSGRDGWIEASALEYVESVTTPPGTDGIEQVVPAAFTSQQFFRIYRTVWTDDEVTASAQHISYDFGKNLIGECAFDFADGYAALNAMTDSLYMPAGNFECYTDISARPDIPTDKQGINWTRESPIKALLDPDIGFCALYSAQCVRDNYSFYLLRQAGLDRGFRVAYGKNLTGIVWDENRDNVVTRIVPVGRTDDDQPLILPEVFVDSPRIGDYPTIHMQALEVSEARVGGKNDQDEDITQDMAYTMMRAAAQAEFDAGADLPVITLTINFINLGDTQEYAAFKRMLQAYVHDLIHVRHERLGFTFSARVIKTTWDAVMLRHTGIEVSTKGFDATSSRIASWQVPSNVEGGKLRSGTVTPEKFSRGALASVIQPDTITGAMIAPNTVADKHIADGAINQSKINGLVGALNALDLRIRALGG